MQRMLRDVAVSDRVFGELELGEARVQLRPPVAAGAASAAVAPSRPSASGTRPVIRRAVGDVERKLPRFGRG